MSEEREVRKLTASILESVESLVDERDAAVARADAAEAKLERLGLQAGQDRCGVAHPTKEGIDCVRVHDHAGAHRNVTTEWPQERCSAKHPTQEGCKCIRDAGHEYAHRNGTIDWFGEYKPHA